MLRTIAYAPDESALLTFEAKQLFAFDAASGAPLWQLELPAFISGVVFVAPNAIGPGPAASPWRSGMSGSAAIAVDHEGALHLIDANSGRLVKTTEPFGTPIAMAGSGSAFAIAVSDRVIVWRDGAKSEVPTVASALAFAVDGTLAIGTKKGAVTIGADSAKQLDVSVLSLAWSARTGWLARTDRGLFAVAGGRKLLEGRVGSLAIDQPSARVAVPRGDQTVFVYAWPIAAFAHTKVALKGRALQDLAFGPSGRLGVGVNRGDAGIVDVLDQSGKSVERHPGREPAKWQLDVGIDPAQLAPPSKTSVAKVGIGGLAFLGLGARLVVALMHSSTSSPNWVPPPDISKLLGCDTTCESGRLADLRKACEATTAINCASDATSAEQSYLVGDCEATRRSLKEVESSVMTGGSEGTSGVYVSQLLAKNGLDGACTQRFQDGVVRFEGTDLRPQQLDLHRQDVEGNFGKAFDVHVADDGATFVTLINHTARSCESRRFEVGAMAVQPFDADCTSAQLFGRGNTVFVAAGSSVKLLTTSMENLNWTGATAMQITGAPEVGGDLWITTAKSELVRYHSGKWIPESLPRANLVLGALAYAEGALYLGAVDSQNAGYLLLRRDKRGAWSVTQSPLDPDPIYVARDNTVYIGRGSEIASSTDKGLTWKTMNLPMQIAAIWARSPTEVYAGGSTGLWRGDGQSWKATDFTESITALSGDSTTMYAVVAHKP